VSFYNSVPYSLSDTVVYLKNVLFFFFLNKIKKQLNLIHSFKKSILKKSQDLVS
jgi:hypothetical protein